MMLDQPPGLADVSGPVCTERSQRFAYEVDEVRCEQRYAGDGGEMSRNDWRIHGRGSAGSQCRGGHILRVGECTTTS